VTHLFIHFYPNERAKKIYNELKRLKKELGCSWQSLFTILLDAYRSQGALEKPRKPIQAYRLYIVKIFKPYRATKVSGRKIGYWETKYLGRTLLYVISLETTLFKFKTRIFEMPEENKRRYVIGSIYLEGVGVPLPEETRFALVEVKRHAFRLCMKDPQCVGIETDPELERHIIYRNNFINEAETDA